jgi:membrane-bound lytic murein transglycosylase B
LDVAFQDVSPIDRILELDQRQPEFTLTFGRYLSNAVTEERVERGRALLDEHAELLAKVQARYGVQPRFLVAFWGLETNFGDYFGSFPVVGALATLAHDTRRSDFFRGELLHALSVLEAGDIAASRMEGSWAGAMGHLQFMPSTFVRYAVDGDGDGRRDIWRSLPDVFASAANYLSEMGWRGDETWGREVRLPPDFDYRMASISSAPEEVKPLAEWQRLGVRRANGDNLPRADMKGGIVLPAGAQGPAFLVYTNYRKILNWNRSIFYALAVGHLADRLIGLPRLSTPPPQVSNPLSRNEVKEIQALLRDAGFDAGEPDGRIGPMTRSAIREFQLSRGVPADAYADRKLLNRLRTASAQ